MQRLGGFFLIAVLLLLGGYVAYLGIRESVPSVPAGQRAFEPVNMDGPVVSISLPHEEPVLPAGPHVVTFQTECTVCHSPRLVLTQPPLTTGQWQAVVRKMVVAYGAHLTPTDEKDIVAYLTAVKGR